jgi:glycosyltransferase involved in cell wall biosynthesis
MRTVSETAGNGQQAPPLVSVVVPVRDDRRSLDLLVDALEHQTLPRSLFEVIIADDGSSGGPPDQLQTGDGWIRVVAGPESTSSAARNRGVSAARGEVLAFCDSDSRPSRSWLEAGLRAIQSADIVGGVVLGTIGARRTIWTALDLDTFHDQERAVRSGFAVTANLFVRRDFFLRANGFDAALHMYGDYDFVARCRAAGAALAFDPTVLVRHPTKATGREFLRKLWAANEAYGRREARTNRALGLQLLRDCIPVLAPLRTRRWAGKSFAVDRKQLRQSGLRPRWEEDLLALPLIYLVLPCVSAVARLAGFRAGRTERTNLAAPLARLAE